MRRYAILLIVLITLFPSPLQRAEAQSVNDYKAIEALHHLNRARSKRNLHEVDYSPTLQDMAEFYALFLADTGATVSHDHFKDYEVFNLMIAYANENRERDLIDTRKWEIEENLAR